MYSNKKLEKFGWVIRLSLENNENRKDDLKEMNLNKIFRINDISHILGNYQNIKITPEDSSLCLYT
jgi:hypothetical protein